MAGSDHVADLLAVLDAHNVNKAHPVGLSLGANVVLGAAIRQPERVAGLVLAAPGLPGHRWRTPRPPEQAAEVARRHGVSAAKRFWLDHPLFAPALRIDAVRAHVAAMVRRYPGAQWTDGPQTDPLPPLADRLDAVRAPTLIVSGTEDLPGYREIAGVLARRVPRARLRVVPDVGHLVNLEAPQTFTEDLLEFLSAVDRGAHAADVCHTNRRNHGGDRNDAATTR